MYSLRLYKHFIDFTMLSSLSFHSTCTKSVTNSDRKYLFKLLILDNIKQRGSHTKADTDVFITLPRSSIEIQSILVNDNCRILTNENIFSTNREPPKISSTNQKMERIERNEWDIAMF